MNEAKSGFRELEHTADWALQVWAPNLETLFGRAAEGMYWLAETELSPKNRQHRELQLQAPDHETMLVAFLNELLFIGEDEGLGFDHFDISLHADSMKVRMMGAEISSRKKEIKAVTFHNLEVSATPQGFKVTIVFDV